MTVDHPVNQHALFTASRPGNCEVLPLENADIRLMRGFLDSRQATELLTRLTDRVEWRRDTVHLFGKRHLIPRLHQWYGDTNAVYRWSGIEMHPLPWLAELRQLREQLQTLLHCRFNSVLINYYRDGSDSMGWHADDETTLGDQPVIASISLGATRDFLLRAKRKNLPRPTRKMALDNGSLLIMAGQTQHFWQHALPKRSGLHAPRINMTFRYVSPQREER